MKYLTAVVAALAIASSAPSYSAPRLLSGDVTESKVAQLTHEIQWHNSLPQCENVARRDGKMIFWMHMLGNLSGAT